MDDKIIIVTSMNKNINDLEIKINLYAKQWFRLYWDLTPVYFDWELQYFYIIMQKY